ncbi:MAG: PAS domain S-box protein [Phycisphaerales bacterium]|nr:PAS domain S-box protein [Phycisphaerales bacterium]
MPFRLWNTRYSEQGALLAALLLGLAATTLGNPSVIGLSMTVLLALLIWSLVRTRTKAIALAESMTESLRASEHRLALVLEATADAPWDWDLDTDQIVASPRFLELLGHERMPSHGKDWMELVHPEDRATFRLGVEQCLVGVNDLLRAEYRMRRRDGEWVWMLCRARMVDRWPDGRGRRLVGANTDITPSKLSDTERDRAYGLLRAVTDESDDAVFVKDPEGRYLMANPALAQIVGRSVDQILGQSDEALFRPEDAVAMRETDRQVMESGEPARFEQVVTTAHGERCFLTTKTVRRDAAGVAIGVVGLSRDVTDYRSALAEAEAANASKSEFLANMSHEIRTPMTAILGFADLLAEDDAEVPSRGRRLEAIDTIRRNGEHLLGIINDILDLSKIEAGKMTVERLRCATLQLVEEAVRLVRVRAEGKGLWLRIDPVFPLPETIETDSVRVRQVLVNLLSNAIKFTERGGVRIRVSFEDTRRPLLRFEVVDTGIGMSDDEMLRLFRPFTQADASTTRCFGGTGLGLTISARLVQMLGGGIEVASAPGMGSTFSATVATGPLLGVRMLDAEGDAPALPALPPANTDRERLDARILLAEDGPDNQRLISFHLRRAGAEVEVVANGRLALAAIRAGAQSQRPFDLVVMDMQMPELDGYEATRRLHAEGVRIPVLALTAHAMSGDRERCLAVGCDGYLAKPVDRATLLAACRELLGRPRARAA